MLNWKRKGLLFHIDSVSDWPVTHAQVPTALVLDDRIRVFFSYRPKPGLSLTSFCDLDSEDVSKVIYVHKSPILETGSAGLFDEHGIMPSAVVNHNDTIFLYYSGWQQSVGVPYNNYTGLAISSDSGFSFQKVVKSPILDRTEQELYSATSPGVVNISEDLWLMLYCSGTDWLNINGKQEHVYDIKSAWSTDGKTWTRDGKPVLPQQHQQEALTRPTLLQTAEHEFHCWFCYRGSRDFRAGTEGYRIGYAQSKDGKNWTRMDQLGGLNPTGNPNDWDGFMTAYPNVFIHDNSLIMLYNGNNFGKAGFGFAQVELSELTFHL
jgi:hypothetical protein